MLFLKNCNLEWKVQKSFFVLQEPLKLESEYDQSCGDKAVPNIPQKLVQQPSVQQVNVCRVSLDDCSYDIIKFDVTKQLPYIPSVTANYFLMVL